MHFSNGNLARFTALVEILLDGRCLPPREARPIIWDAVEDAREIRDISDPRFVEVAIYALSENYRIFDSTMRSDAEKIGRRKIDYFDAELAQKELREFLDNPLSYVGAFRRVAA